MESSSHYCGCYRGTSCTSNSVYLRKPVVRHFLCTSPFFCCCCCCVKVYGQILSFLGQHCRLKQTFLRNVLPPSSELDWIQLQAEVISVGMCYGCRKCGQRKLRQVHRRQNWKRLSTLKNEGEDPTETLVNMYQTTPKDLSAPR